jgi:hypothetical protein
MSNIVDDGGAAFPVPEENRLSNGTYCNEGMSLRDWFAGQALSGQLANRYQDQYGEGQQARRAYEYADAMIAARGCTP